MYRTVVVPLDPTAGADAAIAVGAVVAQQAGATLQLLTVVPPDVDTLKPHDRLAELIEMHGIDAEALVVCADDVALAVLDAAGTPDSLICMGTRARRSIGELVLGSVSERVMRETRHPVLLVGSHCGSAPERFESMVVGLDGSELAESVLPVVGDWSSQLGITPWLFQVLAATVPLELGGDDVHDSAYVHGIAERLARPSLEVEWDVARDRHVAGAIVRFAASRPSSMIALTTHGRSGLSRLALGSVALDVARHATVPVLVVRPSDA
jgi:nucleotide-binding universal stress UspA family protein